MASHTWGKVLGSGAEEVEQASAAIEFGKEKGGVGLGLRGIDPLKAGPDDAVVTTTFAEYATPIATEFHGGLYGVGSAHSGYLFNH